MDPVDTVKKVTYGIGTSATCRCCITCIYTYIL